jgi:hypothetical protein
MMLIATQIAFVRYLEVAFDHLITLANSQQRTAALVEQLVLRGIGK